MTNSVELRSTTVFSRAPDALHADIEGETVMMSVERGEYFGLNSVGSRVWELLEKPQSLDALCAQLAGEYEVDDAQCRADVTHFLREMLKLGIVNG